MKTDITKILIANRGEIACRVIRTARAMNIATVAVYSDADRDTLHVRMADEAVHIGPAPAAESYLVIDKIIDAAQKTKADAIHPGYGFLSENPAFVRACKTANIAFIGPSAEAMEAMGLKDAAKALMSKAGVPVTPGYQGENQDPDHLQEQADAIGYPVLIKAVAGGGGKGMRKVDAAVDFKAALASCQREASSSFGNDHVLIEKYITSPRHIEVQVFGDTHGNVVHMFERDCSLQRRHQKVIEEAPAPGMTDEVRAAMTSAATRAAQAVDYVGAGTVEFIVDGSGPLRTDGFWFMEMNTRLQVEHPVTEEITGLDLVELQIRVARGEALPAQDDITMEGHAIEARLYAEDPANEFLPSAGAIEIMALGVGHRIDSAYTATDREEYFGHIQKVSIFYDPMIAKIIVHEDDRLSAINALLEALFSTAVAPIATNASYLYQLLQQDDFVSGDVRTSLIADSHANILQRIDEADRERRLDVVMGLTVRDTDTYWQDTDHSLQLGRTPTENLAFRLNGPNGFHRRYFINGDAVDVFIDQSGNNGYTYKIDGQHPRKSPYEDATVLDRVQPPLEVTSFSGASGHMTTGLFRALEGVAYRITDRPPDADALGSNANAVTAPMPGKVISMLVAPGDTVTADQPLVILEAMKMEMTLKAPRDGTVSDVGAEEGALVDDGQALVTLTED